MTASNQAIGSIAKTQTKKAPPYRLYAFLLAMIFSARVFALITQDTEWAIGVYASSASYLFFLALSVALSIASAFYFKQHLPPL